MKKVLIITRHTPLPWEDGAGAYLHDVAQFLAGHGFQVDVLWLKPHEHLRWQKLWRLPAAFSAAVHLHLPDGLRLGRAFLFPAVVWQPWRAHVLGFIRRGLARIGVNPPRRNPPALVGPAVAPDPWSAPTTAAEAALVARFVRRHRPDVVIANYAWMCPVFDLPELRAVRRVCLTCDIGWQRAGLAVAGTPPEFTRDDEAAWLQRASMLIAISEADAAELRRLAPRADVVFAPKAAAAHAALPASGNSRLLFVGSENAFNTEGLTWFLAEVWPQIRAARPDAELDVCGSIIRSISLRPTGVAFHGMVDSLAAHYAAAAVVIVPLRRATGMNIKLVEAAACGRAIVTTSHTLGGVPWLRDAVAVADSAADFAAAVRQFLDHPATGAASAARALSAVNARLSPRACYGPLAARLDQAA